MEIMFKVSWRAQIRGAGRQTGTRNTEVDESKLQELANNGVKPNIEEIMKQEVERFRSVMTV